MIGAALVIVLLVNLALCIVVVRYQRRINARQHRIEAQLREIGPAELARAADAVDLIRQLRPDKWTLLHPGDSITAKIDGASMYAVVIAREDDR